MAHLPACRVLPGGPYIISPHIFPSYFSGAKRHAANHAALDLHLFGQRIAPALGISQRFIGTEPLSEVTAAYNTAMRAILPTYGIVVHEVPRLEADGAAISAARLRAALAAGNLEEALRYAPRSTIAFLRSDEGARIINLLGQKK